MRMANTRIPRLGRFALHNSPGWLKTHSDGAEVDIKCWYLLLLVIMSTMNRICLWHGNFISPLRFPCARCFLVLLNCWKMLLDNATFAVNLESTNPKLLLRQFDFNSNESAKDICWEWRKGCCTVKGSPSTSTFINTMIFIVYQSCNQWWIKGWEARGKAERGHSDDVIILRQPW